MLSLRSNSVLFSLPVGTPSDMRAESKISCRALPLVPACSSCKAGRDSAFSGNTQKLMVDISWCKIYQMIKNNIFV